MSTPKPPLPVGALVAAASLMAAGLPIRSRPMTTREVVPPKQGHKRKFKGSKAAKRGKRK